VAARGTGLSPLSSAVDRRSFLRGAARAAAALSGAAALGPVAGCATSGSRSGPGHRSSGAPTTSSPAPAGPPDWSRLAAALSGSLVLPGSPGYATGKLLYDERFDTLDPAAIAYIRDTADVQHCIEFARASGVPLAARSGGHSYGGYSLSTGLVVDVTALNSVAPDVGAGQVVVGAGTRLIDLYAATDSAGVLVPGGSCPTVGIAGLALGGGVGVLGRAYGLTADAIQSLDIVTADGRAVRADGADDADLYWACRGGGGGNFGIVTSFTFATRPIPPLALFTLHWPWAAAADVLAAWQTWTASATDEVWSNCQLLSAGTSGPEVKVTGVFIGTSAGASSELAPLIAAVGSAPSSQFVGPESYLRAMLIEAGCEGDTVAQCHLSGSNPAGQLSRAAFEAKSAYIRDPLPPSGLGAVVEAVWTLSTELPTVGGGFVFDAYGGAINRVAAADTAFVHRDMLAAIEYSFSYGTGAPTTTIGTGRDWLSSAQTTLSPHAVGAYQNYIDPTQPDWLTAYYGTNLARLVDVKSRYDPDDVFHFAQSIPTRL
jgi:FAD/FMN-containing dehydrogenase